MKGSHKAIDITLFICIGFILSKTYDLIFEYFLYLLKTTGGVLTSILVLEVCAMVWFLGFVYGQVLEGSWKDINAIHVFNPLYYLLRLCYFIYNEFKLRVYPFIKFVLDYADEHFTDDK